MISLASKKSRLLMCIILINICKAASKCYKGDCPIALSNGDCSLRERHISQFIIHLDKTVSPMINQLVNSCTNDISCEDCEISKPGGFCGFGDFAYKVTYRNA